jgi:hypothetical protein
MGYDTERPDAYDASTSEATVKRVAEESARHRMILVF